MDPPSRQAANVLPMNITDVPRTTTPTPVTAAARLRFAALVAVPVLALSVACGGGADSAEGAKESSEIADVPAGPGAADKGADKGADKDGGTGAGADASKGEFYDAQMKYVQCMRGKGGFKDFPDPKLSGYLDWEKVEEIASKPGQTEAYKGGRKQACGSELRDALAAEPRRDEQKGYESMLAHAKCMRDNGVSRFTNPTMSGGIAQPGGDPNPANPALDSASPAYEKAQKACRSKLIDSVAGMQ
ncbi:hypothetical protein [Streptomyces laurentii]|uniref:hypothetical protein n=1 Tax=Streptomyces laurentii TaxID=39478 RepID=UPI0036B76CC4